MIEIKKGQKLIRLIGNTRIEITITELSTREVSFLVAGAGVEKPDEPRTMPVTAFVKWVNLLKNTPQEIAR